MLLQQTASCKKANTNPKGVCVCVGAVVTFFLVPILRLRAASLPEVWVKRSNRQPVGALY